MSGIKLSKTSNQVEKTIKIKKIDLSEENDI
jgi:hypothetical protein